MEHNYMDNILFQLKDLQITSQIYPQYGKYKHI